MFEYEQECLEVFLENQEQLLGRKEMETLEDADAFLSDCMAVVCDSLKEVREYFEEAGMDAYGMDDEELLSQSEVFPLSRGRFLVVEG
ncbi:MAG: glyoxalase [Lachnospiraceae bacterium]